MNLPKTTSVPTFGQVSQIGPHRVRHGDVMDGLHDLMQTDKATLTYVDPPWGPGALRMFATLMEKQTGQRPSETDFVVFMDRLFKLIAWYTDGYAIVEYSVRWPNLVSELAMSNGLQVLGLATAAYGRPRRPLHLHVLRNGGPDRPWEKVVKRLSETQGGFATTVEALPLIHAGEVLLDPCCGLGFSARLACKAGAHFRGNEINEARLERTVGLLTTGSTGTQAA